MRVLLVVVAAAMVAIVPASATADLIADVVLYETSETITPPTRTAPLLGSAKLTSPLCLAAAALGQTTCTITGTGSADVPAGTNVAGSLAVVVEGSVLNPLLNTNAADVAEVVITGGVFQAPGIVPLPLPPGTPKGLKKKLQALEATRLFVRQQIQGVVAIDYGNPVLCGLVGGCPRLVNFTGTFRLPFALRHDGQGGPDDDVERPRRGKAAFYLGDTGKLIKVRTDERAVGYATPRLEVNFTP